MIKIILKNLWNSRTRNAWLFAELIIVTVLTWAILDPTIVSIYDITSPSGYDADRIVNVTINCVPPNSAQYNPECSEPDAAQKNYDNLLLKASSLPGVEKVLSCYAGINSVSSFSTYLRVGDESIDTLSKYVFIINFDHNAHPLSTYGLEAAEGSPSIKELESRPLGENELIITESIDRIYWPERRGIKDKRFINPFSRDTVYQNVVGIVKDFRHLNHVRTNAVVIQGSRPTPAGYFYSATLVMRLKDGIDADSYIEDNRGQIIEDLTFGNFFVKSIKSQRQEINDMEYMYGITSQRNLQLFVAILFLANLILGVTGCVWLQTRKRINELGVLRSYGASRAKIMSMLFGESIILATTAFLIGEIIYLQYALYSGLSNGYEGNSNYFQSSSWVTDFGEHFAIVSAIVYAVIIICVCIGTYFPARHAANINPVDALRDE